MPIRRPLSRRSLLAAATCAPALFSNCSSVGQAAPDFEVKTQFGRTVSPRTYRGKLLLITFWATW